MTTINRRAFVRAGSLALVAMGLPPAFLERTLLAEAPKRAGQKTLICIFQRGAVDGLNMVVPFGDKEYYARRRAIAIPATGNNAALDLDGYFGLHPALAPLQPLFKRNEMAVVHAVGSPNPTRSHFDAQDFMETGTPGLKSTKDGWLNRVLQNTDCSACSTTGRSLADGAAHTADHTVGQAGMATAFNPALRAIAMGAAMPTALRGREPALAISDLTRFGVGTTRDGDAQSAFERVYGTAAPDIVTGAADEAFEAVRILKAINPTQYRPAAGITYPAGDFGRSLQQIAQLIKAGVPVEIAFADIGGWDTHQNQGAATGQLATRFTEFSRGIRALYDDLGDKMDDVVILTMSEFGRTVAENGTGGTDHGHANCMLVMGGAVAGGKVRGEWPGLAREQLYQGRDLNITTDFRDVFAEVVSKHLKTQNMDKVFPDHQVKAANFRGVITG
jgi:uncharacterized protein (DUF1501 family)